MINYRKIYENFYGKIPKDKEGKTYEIHHIDGNRKNNSKENLVAVSIQKHYEIHYKQNDFRACHAIALRMNKTVEEISLLASLAQHERVKKGNHHFLGGKIQSRYNRQLVEKNKHHWQTSEHSKRVSEKNKRLADENKHNFQTTMAREAISKRNKIAINDGSHPFVNGVGAKNSRERIINGTHHFLDKTKQKVLSEKAKFKNSYLIWRSDNLVYIGISDVIKDNKCCNRRRLEKAIKNNTEYLGYLWKNLGKGCCSTTIPKGSIIKRLETQNT